MDTLLQVATSWIIPAIFFWFLLSLIAMTLIEAVQQMYGSRPKGLEKVLRSLVGEPLAQRLYEDPLVNPLKHAKFSTLLQGLSARWFKAKPERPSYISQSLFAKVVLTWILPPYTIPTRNKVLDQYIFNKDIHRNIESLSGSTDQFRHVLHSLVTEAYLKTETPATFLEAIDKNLQTWFLEAVNQMSPRYAASLQALTLLISLAVAIVANFDVLDLTTRLWMTSKVPEWLAIVNAAPDQFKPNLDSNLQALIMTPPVGWEPALLPSTFIEWILKPVGLLLGGFFIAFGSKYIYNLTKRQYIPSK